jgi:hypothetical protein
MEHAYTVYKCPKMETMLAQTYSLVISKTILLQQINKILAQLIKDHSQFNPARVLTNSFFTMHFIAGLQPRSGFSSK